MSRKWTYRIGYGYESILCDGVMVNKEQAVRALNNYESRIAELESGGIQIQYMSEDELPENISSDVYSAMFRCSKVDFVRLFPFVMVDGRKLFLIDLEAAK